MRDSEQANVVRSGRPAVGTALHVPDIGPVTVVANNDPSLVTLETASGATLRMGERVLAAALDEQRDTEGSTEQDAA